MLRLRDEAQPISVLGPARRSTPISTHRVCSVRVLCPSARRLAGLLFVLALAVSFAVLPTQAQVYTGDLVVRTQSELDALPAYTEITGSLTVGYAWYENPPSFPPPDPITRLTLADGTGGLSMLTSVGGDLHITWTDLTHLDGLGALTSIGGDLHVDDNGFPDYLDITALQNVSSIGGDVRLNKIGGADLSGLQGLTSLDGSLAIYIDDELASLEGLNLTTIGGSLSLYRDNTAPTLAGLEGIATIGGALTIANPEGLQSLEGLSGLTSIGGDLEIRSSRFVFFLELKPLPSLEGLDNLQAIGGSLEITGITELSDLSGLSSLQSVDGVRFWDLPDLTSIDALSGTLSTPSDVELINLPLLSSLNGLTGITEVAGNLYLDGLDAITSLDPLAGLTSVGDDLDLSDLESLMSLGPLSQLVSVGDDLSLRNLDRLTSLDGLQALESIGEDLSLSSNASLTSLDGLQNLRSMGDGVWIYDHPDLQDCSALSGDLRMGGLFRFQEVGAGCQPLVTFEGDLTLESQDDVEGARFREVTGSLSIEGGEDSAQITDLSPLSGLEAVGDRLKISCPYGLTSLQGLENLTSVGEDVRLDNNFELTSLVGLSGLTRIHGDLWIDDNANLTDLTGLSALEQAESIWITENDKLETLEGLDNLTTIDDRLYVWGNPALTSLAGLEALISVKDVTLNDNSSLESLAGMDNLSTIYVLNVSNSPSLTSLEGVNIPSGVENGIALTLWLTDNVALQSLSGLEALRYANYVHLTNNPSLTDLTALSGLLFTHYIHVVSNAQLTSLEGIGHLSFLHVLTIRDNPSLTSLEAMEGLTQVGYLDWPSASNLEITGNAALTSLHGLHNLLTVGHDLNVSNNPTLADCSALDALQQVGGTITFSGNAPGCNAPTPVLPVELTLFDALADGSDVHLLWETASELLNAGFQVETATDGETFTALGFVDGHGTTSEVQRYTFTHEAAGSGMRQYRLKQVDYDGTFAYSPVVEVELAVPGGYRVEGVYPNPMRGRGQVRFVVEQRQRVTVSVYDVLGRRVEVVWSGMAEAGVSESVEVGVSGWPSGSYVVRVEGERFAETQRVVVVR